jgi:predicted SAM-dependent methyltransferase
MRPALESYLSHSGPHRLEIGAGRGRKPGWLATDLGEAGEGDGYMRMDATQPFPIPDASFDIVYSEHMIEHVPYLAGRAMIRECHRILKPGGVLRISTPSLGFLLRIMSPDRSAFEQGYLEWTLVTHVPEAPIASNAFFLNLFVRQWGHLFIYDRETLGFVMRKAGFADVKECRFNCSDHPDLVGLENEGRMPPGYVELESMVFEGRKPG